MGQMIWKNNKKIPRALPGFAIGASVSVFSWLGISGLLFIIEKSRLPEEQLAIFSSLFYGIVFFIALGGVRAESRRYKLLISRNIYGDLPALSSEPKTTLKRIKTLLWSVFCVFALGWVTPALVIYWSVPKHTGWAVAACACLSSLVAGVSFVFKRKINLQTSYDQLMFFGGLFLGVALLVRTIV